MSKVPVLIIIYNRPDTTKKVWEQLAKIQPEQLVIAGDGPQTNSEMDKEKVSTTRNWLEDNLTWKCDVTKIYSDTNIGLRRNVLKGLEVLFSKYEKGIILEDDTIPHVDFFGFCEEMLSTYEDDHSVFCVSGFNPHGYWPGMGSYFFSHLFACWGWACWRRSWELFQSSYRPDLINKNLKAKLETRYLDQLSKKRLGDHQKNIGSNVDSWAYQFSLLVDALDKKVVVPRANMVQNIGFRDDATHTMWKNDPRGQIGLYKQPSVYKSPYNIDADKAYDRFTFYMNKGTPIKYPLYLRFLRKLKRVV